MKTHKNLEERDYKSFPCMVILNLKPFECWSKLEVNTSFEIDSMTHIFAGTFLQESRVRQQMEQVYTGLRLGSEK